MNCSGISYNSFVVESQIPNQPFPNYICLLAPKCRKTQQLILKHLFTNSYITYISKPSHNNTLLVKLNRKRRCVTSTLA